MKFKTFNRLWKESAYDDIQVIGKDVEKEGRYYHIIGMTLKEKKANLYVLEFLREPLEREERKESTPRESLKMSMDSQRNESCFFHTREIKSEGKTYEIAGATSGAMKYGEYDETYMLFYKMYEAGWKIEEHSNFFDVPWENLAITNLEFREKMEALPEIGQTMEILTENIPKECAIEKPVLLECGKTMEIEFPLKDGRNAVCYLNKIDTMDVWADSEKKFADSDYRKRMLQHMTEVELEEMKENFFKVLEEHCPKGSHYMTLEYECSEDVGLRFYDREHLDTLPEVKKGSASALFMTVKPEKKTGIHELKLRGYVVQKPLEAGVKKLEAELFSYSEPVQKKTEKLW